MQIQVGCRILSFLSVSEPRHVHRISGRPSGLHVMPPPEVPHICKPSNVPVAMANNAAKLASDVEASARSLDGEARQRMGRLEGLPRQDRHQLSRRSPGAVDLSVAVFPRPLHLDGED